ncbi:MULTISPECIES: pyridoxamine 5'-phosphate oxidase family protein [unclassified Streptomyces]|uniref:pyridoxamine 5'-phosphate oxidase family protein n=1 Tax=unclassified Streptomyces TaxID=2593676 RepID=UPI0035E05D2D
MSGSPAPNVREWLRELEVFAGPLPSFDPAGAPEEPEEPFLVWLGEAVAAGLPDPHAMTLSTVDEHGDPWARVLILKNIDEHGWQFAAHADSPKGRHLSARPTAALSPSTGPLSDARSGSGAPSAPSRPKARRPTSSPARRRPARRRCRAAKAGAWTAPPSGTRRSRRPWAWSNRTRRSSRRDVRRLRTEPTA